MYVYGKNVMKECMNKKSTIHEVFLLKTSADKRILDYLSYHQIPYSFCERKKLDQLVSGNHQGIVLKIPDFVYSDVEDLLLENEKIVLLDHIEDPHNMGAIIRTCEAAGIKGIIIPKDRSVDINGTVMKTSVGALEFVKVAKVTNVVNTMEFLKKKGYWIVGTDMEGEDYKTLSYEGKIVLIISNEGKGISRIVKEHCDYIAKIPMYGNINSLNASVAAGIMIYEMVRG